jgi:protoporphyrinogen oxidase
MRANGLSNVRAVDRVRPGQHVVVIGAGPAGLTAAYFLSKQGVDVTVIEADELVGGISRTAQYNGYRFDIGGHRFFTKIAPVQALWDELLGDEFMTVPRLSRIHHNGTFFDYPLKPMNVLRGLGVIDTIRIIGSYLQAHFRPSLVEENFEQWVTNRFGRRLYESFFKTYTEKVWGMPCTEISAEWAAQRISGLSLTRAILTGTSLGKRRMAIKSLIDEFRYPRLGPGQVWEACRDRVRDMGNRVLLGHRAMALHCTDDQTGTRRVRGVHVQTDDGEFLLRADHVIATMPLRSLVQGMRPAAPEPALAAARALRYRDFLVVALVLRGDDLFPDNWLYIHTPGVKVGRIQNFNNWSRAMVAEPNRTCLGMEYFCSHGDPLWASSDADLIRLAACELEQLGLGNADAVVDGAVVRVPKAYPTYDTGYAERLVRIREFLDPIPNLHTVGRNGMHKYNNQDHSMLTAMMAVWNMLGTNGAPHDIWSVNTDYEYHESQRLDDPEEILEEIAS